MIIMRGAYIRALVLSVVMVSGLLLVNIGVDGAFAEKGGQGKSQGTPASCDKDTKKNPSKNPNCVDSGDGPCDVGADPEGDCDGDTILNKDDVCPDNHTDTVGQTDEDCDGDGLSNFFEEFTVECLDKTNADTDGDGFTDGEEIGFSDPCNFFSTPT